MSVFFFFGFWTVGGQNQTLTNPFLETNYAAIHIKYVFFLNRQQIH